MALRANTAITRAAALQRAGETSNARAAVDLQAFSRKPGPSLIFSPLKSSNWARKKKSSIFDETPAGGDDGGEDEKECVLIDLASKSPQTGRC